MKNLISIFPWKFNRQRPRDLSAFLPEGFHGDHYLMDLVQAIAGQAEIFIETGTNVGSTLAYVARSYPHLICYSCEPDLNAFLEAKRNVGDRENVYLFNETSQIFLQRLTEHSPEIFQKSCMFWLDAHGYGFEWPLREEIAFITDRFSTAFILIDDFKVPGNPQFSYDRYRRQECTFEYIKSALNPSQLYHVIYPDYKEHTSAFHPLIGWVLIYFGSVHSELPTGLKIKIEQTFDPTGW